MKKCNTQIMKEIKTLEEYRAKWINVERANCTVSYLQGEEPVMIMKLLEQTLII